MQDVEKTEIQRQNDVRRMRRRNRLRPLYGLVVAVLVVGVGVALSMTVFFNIDTIVVAGDAPYSKEQVVNASEVHTGDNLMRVPTKTVKERILETLPNVETVTIKRQFPNELVITVTPCQASFNVTDDSGTLQVSASGKILKSGPDTDSTLPTITGFSPASRVVGDTLQSKDSQKDSIFSSLSKLMAGDLTYKITAIDLEDKYDIVLTFDNRIEFSLGNWNDLSYKVTLAETVLSQLSEDKVGYLTMVGDNQCSYRDKSAVEQQTTAPEVTTATDEAGNPVTETDEQGNPISTTTETTAVSG